MPSTRNSTTHAARAARAATATGDARPDAALVADFQRGDASAFDAIVARYRHLLCRLAAHHLASPADAPDVVQESFLRAWRGLARFRGDSALSTWLYRIVINTAASHRVRNARHVPVGATVPEDATGPDPLTAPRPETPEEIVLDREFARAAGIALAALSGRLRHTVVLHERRGLSYEQIAALTDVPIGTVRSRIFRARRFLAERMGAAPAD